MKTYTTYAEKKAKQLFNLLQGYTKGIRMTAILILLLMGVGSVNAETIMRVYCKNTQSWWKADNAAVGAYYWGTGGNANSWPGTRMTKVSGQTDLWYIDVDIDKYQNIIFTRVNASGTIADWGAKTNDLTIANTKNQYTITQSSGAWNGATSAGSWGTYKPTSTVSLTASPASVYVGEDVTLTPSLSSNTEANTYSSTSYSVSPATASVNGNTFTATAAGTYTVTATITYYAKGCPSLTSTATATTTITVETDDTYSLTVTAGAGIASVAGSIDPVTLGNTYDIEATPKTGYTFSTWTANPAANATFGSAITANTTVTVKNGSVIVTASATETLHAITVQSSDDNHGTITQSADKAGIETSITITAEPEEGYRFVNWTTETDEITIADPNSAFTTVTATAAGTVTANFEKIPDKIVYLKPNSNWKKDGARFAAYAFGGAQGNEWYDMTDVGCSGEYYYCEIPAKYTSVIFVRMNPADAENKWNNNNQGPVWNQTGDLTIEEGKVFTITNWGDGSWGTYTTPTYDITLTQTTGGTIAVSKSSDITLNEQVTVTMTADPGYSFQSGTIKIGNQEEQTISTTESIHTICGPTTITATWKPDTHTVTFDANGHGTAPDEQSVDHNEKVEEPEAPTANGYTFGGWYKEANCTNAWNFDTDVVTADMTLYAKWTPTEYNITYIDLYGVTHSNPETYTIESETITFTNPTSERTGYTFAGWNPTKIEKGSTGDKTVTAQWTEITYAVTISAGANGSVNPSGTQQVGASGLSVTATANTGYKFKNWTVTDGAQVTDANSATTTVTATAEGTVTANFSAINYTITYHLDGGTNHAGNPTNYTIETPTITLQDPTRNGYTFGGWYNNSSFSGSPITTISQGSTDNITLYAKWTENKSTITVTTAYSEQGTLKFGSTTKDWGTTASVGVTTTKNITATANNGYKFVRWELTGGAQSSSTLTDATITLKGDGNGTEGTATAVFEEDLSTSYVLKGGSAFGGTAWSTEYKLEKKSGQSTIDIAYVTFTLNSTNIGNSNDDFNFKIVKKGTDDTWYGLTADGSYWYNRSTGEQTLSTPGANIQLRADVTGTYEIKVDYTDVYNNPKITVIFPSSSMSLVGTFNDWNESANPFVIDGDIATATIDLPMGEYEFKINDGGTWRTMTADSRVVTRDANQDINFNTTGGSGNNTILNADATGTYTFIYNISSQTLTVEYPDIAIRLTGEFNGWNDSDDNYKFAKSSTPGIYTLTKHFDKRERWQAYGKEQAEYEFKLNINGKSYTVEGDGAAKVLQYTRQNTTKIVNDGTDYTEQPYYNLLLQADQNGDYLFTYDSYTRQLTVTHPTYEPEASYIVGDFSDNQTGTDAMPKDGGAGHDWTETYGQELEDGVGCIELGKNSTWNFKIKINGIWYGADIDAITTSGTYTLDDEYADTGEKNVTIKTTNEDGCYYFEYTLNDDDGTLSVLIIFPNDRRIVTFEMQGHGTQVDPQHVLYNQTAVKPYVSDVDGYLFAGWYTDAACTKEYDFNTPVTQDITLYAKWIPYGDCIFYKNNLNWDEVYVYFYSSDKYWTDGKGTGANMDSEFPMNSSHRPHYRKFRGKMTRIGLTDIWYFDYISAAKRIDPTNWEQIKDHTDNADNDINYSNIAFTAHEQYDHSFFDNTKVIRRGDFKPQMQLFIPQTDQTPTYLNKHDGVSAKYYNKGLWLKYNSTESGYNWSSNVGNWDNNTNYFTSEIAGGYSFTAEVELNAGSTYDFKIHNQNGTWYGNPGTMTQDNCTNWWFKEEVKDNAKIKPTVNGTYIFTAYLGDGKVMISLDYPLSTGDYRLAYLDSQAGSFHPGHYLKKRSTSHLDTVSFFIHHDKQPQVIAQRCTAIDAQGNATWEEIASIQVNPAASITESGVYNFTLQQIEGQLDPQLLSEPRSYTGDYYIRTDAAPGGWKSFRQESNKMTYTSYADEHEDFNHYFCEWVSQEKGLKNVKYTVANDYSYCISDTLLKDIDPNHPEIVINEEGDLPKDNKDNLINANVRFGWDSKTNKLRRAYIAGSGHKKDRFLVLEGNEHLADINGNRYTGQTAEGQDRYNLTDDEVVLDDMGNWIYQMDVQANNLTKIKLTARYNELVQYFKGTETESVALLESTAGTNYKIRLIYDFKTNHLVIAWLAGGETIDGDEQKLGADMMIIRRNQDPAEQLNFDPTTRQLSGVGTAYAVMTFDKYFLNNKDKITGNALAQADEKSENERKFYWISFPFDVKLSDVFGFGEYGDQWIMQYYDGAARAQNGYWIDSPSFWKYITNKNYVLQAGQGYVLCLNLNKMGFTSTVFANTTEVSLYFPSASPLNEITGELPTAVTVPAHECTIERDNRNIYDSNWNLIGVPGFADITGVSIGESHHKEINADCVSFYYKYLPGTNTYSAKTQTEAFQTMYAYMVQFAGTINWKAKTMPAQLAARRTGSMPSQYDLRLELAQGEETDQTFVQLKEEDATAEFDMNVDMTKIFNSGMNIYTLTGSNAIQVAGNALPMAKATIPVGVVTATAGEYTFRMPDGTDGISVFLIDNQTGAQTNMLLDEYTVMLDAGTCENRFYLAVDPDRTATSVENIGEEAKDQIKKFLIDGQLFIRTTDGTFDAKGQRM